MAPNVGENDPGMRTMACIIPSDISPLALAGAHSRELETLALLKDQPGFWSAIQDRVLAAPIPQDWRFQVQQGQPLFRAQQSQRYHRRLPLLGHLWLYRGRPGPGLCFGTART